MVILIVLATIGGFTCLVSILVCVGVLVGYKFSFDFKKIRPTLEKELLVKYKVNGVEVDAETYERFKQDKLPEQGVG